MGCVRSARLASDVQQSPHAEHALRGSFQDTGVCAFSASNVRNELRVRLAAPELRVCCRENGRHMTSNEEREFATCPGKVLSRKPWAEVEEDRRGSERCRREEERRPAQNGEPPGASRHEPTGSDKRERTGEKGSPHNLDQAQRVLRVMVGPGEPSYDQPFSTPGFTKVSGPSGFPECVPRPCFLLESGRRKIIMRPALSLDGCRFSITPVECSKRRCRRERLSCRPLAPRVFDV